MKKIFVLLTTLFLCSLFAFGFSACTIPNESQGLKYTLLADDTYELSDIEYSTDPKVVIPSSYNGKAVTSIGENAFSECYDLTAVTIGKNVTSIGDSAFYNCYGLTSLEIPGSVTSIGDSAFDNCYGLTSVIIGDSVTSIGKEAFFNCSRLTSVVIPDSVTSIGDSAFSSCDGLTSVIIGDSVTSIGKEAFYHCSRLTSLTIPDGVTTIGDSAFDNCYGLTSVIIGNSVTSIGEWAFDNCYGLTSLTIPDSVTSIGERAFRGCSELTSVTIGKNVTSIAENAFENCDSLTSIAVSEENTAYVIDDNVLYNKAKTKLLLVPKAITGEVKLAHGITTIEATTFSYRSNLTSLEIPSSVTSIHENAFENCYGLMNITVSEDNTAYASFDGILYNKAKTEIVGVPKNITGDVELAIGITSIGNQAFYQRYNLKSIEIPDSVTSIGSEAFSCCSSLTSVTLGKGLTSIGSEAFAYSRSLTSVEIPDSGVSIGNSAFEDCESLTSVTIPDSVVAIGLYAFRDCDNLQYNEYENAKYLGNETNNYCALMAIVDKNVSDFTFLSDTKIIASSAFENCVNLTSIEIPETIKSIGASVFGKCTGLTSVKIPDTVSFISTGAFFGCGPLKEVTCPTSALSCFGKGNLERLVLTSGESLPDYAFVGMSCLMSVTIPKSVTSIGAYAFELCKCLTIYCEAESQPNSWNRTWNSCRWDDSSCPVVWDYKNNDVATDGYIYVVLDGVRYALKDGVATVVRQSSGIKTAIISESVTYKEIEYPVTSIVDSAFYYCSRMTKVVIPNSIISIGDEVFHCCTSLTEIVIPDSVTSLGKKALNNCHVLTSIVIPKSLTSIGENAFDYSHRLASVYYFGTAEDWAKIQIASGNFNLTSATIYYYIEKEEDVPTDGGKYWHYDDEDNMVVW